MLIKTRRLRKKGPREPSGRPSRRKSDLSISLQKHQAETLWDELTRTMDSSDLGYPGDHPLLILVRLRKFDPGCFAIALYWAVTRHDIATDWNRRQFLTQITGFNFTTKRGCASARRFAVTLLGQKPIGALDAAVYGREIDGDITALADNLRTLWAAWLDHRKRVHH